MQWRERLEFAEERATEQSRLVLRELELVRAGLGGDAMGWAARQDGTFFNSETGEVRDDQPEVLFIVDIVLRAEQADRMTKEVTALREKTEAAVLARNEADIAALRLRTELNSFRALHRQWVEAAGSVGERIASAGRFFEEQSGRVRDAGVRLESNEQTVSRLVSELGRVASAVRALQSVVAEQRRDLDLAGSRVRSLEDELASRQRTIDRLTKAFDEELAAVLRPMRDRLAETSSSLLKLSARRVNELRDLAALWPAGHLMPTLLALHRPRSEEERRRAMGMAQEAQASLALAEEIRRRVREREAWRKTYDDYGRPVFSNSETGEVVREEPDALSYRPPPGRDEAGALIAPHERDWTRHFRVVSVEGDRVLYENNETKEVVDALPTDLVRAPRCRTAEEAVREAAQIVLAYIKGVLGKRQGNDALDRGLDQILYDMETIEMLAGLSPGDASTEPGRARLHDDAMPGEYPRPFEVDPSELSVAGLREILKTLAEMEERHEASLSEIRSDLKDFSLMLVDRASASASEAKQSRAEGDPADSAAVREADDMYDLEPFSSGLGVYLFGDLSNTGLMVHDSKALDFSSTSTDLVNLALFCGFKNIGMSDANLRKTWPELSLAEDDESESDERWLTASYFIATSRERIDHVFEAIRDINHELFTNEVPGFI